MAALTVWPVKVCEYQFRICQGPYVIQLRVSPVRKEHTWHHRCFAHPYKYGKVFWKWEAAASHVPLELPL